MDSDDVWGWLFWGALIAGGIWWWNSGDTTPSYDTESYSGSYYSDESEDLTIDRDEAIDSYWDDIRDYLTTSTTIEACSSSGCYELDADISSGILDTIYFPNGGYIEIGDYISDSGYAYGEDSDGDEWEIYYSLDSYEVDDAVEEWADDNGYTLL
ncbi:MAG: hypothetical protein WEA04_01000 [Candidatus Andersenbacteria bacterium]